MTRSHFSAHTAAVIALLTATLPLSASAQSTVAAPTRMRAIINAVRSSAADMADTFGGRATVTLPVDISVARVASTEPSAIRAGSYIDAIAVRKPDSVLRTLEVHASPEAMRGTGGDHHPHDLRPSSSMTNGTVEQAGIVTGVWGHTLSAKHKDGEQRIMVPSQVPIVTFGPGRRDDLKAGAHVVVFVRAGAQGTLVAQRMLVDKDGMIPPM